MPGVSGMPTTLGYSHWLPGVGWGGPGGDPRRSRPTAAADCRFPRELLEAERRNLRLLPYKPHDDCHDGH